MSKKYVETGRRAEVIKQKTVLKAGFKSEQELADKIREFTEADLSLRQISENLGIGVDAIKRIRNDYGIAINSRANVIKNGVKSTLGVENVMNDPSVKQKHLDGIRAVFDQRGTEIAKKGWETRRINRFTEESEE